MAKLKYQTLDSFVVIYQPKNVHKLFPHVLSVNSSVCTTPKDYNVINLWGQVKVTRFVWNFDDLSALIRGMGFRNF